MLIQRPQNAESQLARAFRPAAEASSLVAAADSDCPFHSGDSISTECATRHSMKRRIVEAGLAYQHVGQQRQPYLFVAQRDHRINSRSSPRRNVARGQRNQRQQYSHSADRHGIVGVHAV